MRIVREKFELECNIELRCEKNRNRDETPFVISIYSCIKIIMHAWEI